MNEHPIVRTWKQLQLMQHLHDLHFHADVAQMTQSHRVQHLALHIAKYGCRLSIAHGGRDYENFSKILIDSLIVGVSLANVVKVDLAKVLPTPKNDGPHLSILSMADEYDAKLEDYVIDASSDTRRNMVYHIVDIVSQLSDLSEKWDHCEGELRPKLRLLVERYIMVIVVALKVFEIGNIETKYIDRLLFIESKDIFFYFKARHVHLKDSDIIHQYVRQLASKHGL